MPSCWLLASAALAEPQRLRRGHVRSYGGFVKNNKSRSSLLSDFQLCRINHTSCIKASCPCPLARRRHPVKPGNKQARGLATIVEKLWVVFMVQRMEIGFAQDGFRGVEGVSDSRASEKLSRK